MEISAAQVKLLREKTGAGPMECKKALQECEGDLDKAEKALKEKGLAAVEQRAGRATNEGKIFAQTSIKNGSSQGVLLELSCETDFVARNPEFIALGDAIATLILERGYTEPNDELNGMVLDLATKIRENMSLKRFQVIHGGEREILSKYIHGDGAIGVLVKLAADSPEDLTKDEVKTLAFDLALHTAAFNPLALDRDKIDPAFIAEQKEIYKKQIETDEKLAGKSETVLQNALNGKINKYLSEICFLEQGFIKEEKNSVAKTLENLSKQVGTTLRITDYGYFKVGGS